MQFAWKEDYQDLKSRKLSFRMDKGSKGVLG